VPQNTVIVPYQTPRVVHLASQVLPGAGAFTNQGVFALPVGCKKVVAYVTYTRGAANGFPRFQPMLGNGTEETQGVVVNPSSLDVTTAPPQGRYNVFMEQINGPIPTGAGAISYSLRFCLDGGYTTFRLLVTEAGVVDTPGTIAIALTTSGG